MPRPGATRATTGLTQVTMPHEFTHKRTVEFAETDMAGIVHFSNFFRYMEATEHAFFASLGLDLHAESEGRMSGWVRVHASCDYRAPVRNRDPLSIHLTVIEKTSKSLRYRCVFRVDGSDQDVARGEMKVVYVSKARGDERMRAHDMPADTDRLIQIAPH